MKWLALLAIAFCIAGTTACAYYAITGVGDTATFLITGASFVINTLVWTSIFRRYA